MPYNRVVKDLAGRTPEAFLAGPARARRRGARRAEPGEEGRGVDVPRGRLVHDAPEGARQGRRASAARSTCSLLQEQVLAPVLNIGDPRTDKRIDFVGGIRGTGELERLVKSGKAAVAFSMFPVGVDDLMRIADAGEIMPPKSTWFEPKLRDGLLTHLI